MSTYHNNLYGGLSSRETIRIERLPDCIPAGIRAVHDVRCKVDPPPIATAVGATAPARATIHTATARSGSWARRGRPAPENGSSVVHGSIATIQPIVGATVATIIPIDRARHVSASSSQYILWQWEWRIKKLIFCNHCQYVCYTRTTKMKTSSSERDNFGDSDDDDIPLLPFNIYYGILAVQIIENIWKYFCGE